METIFDQLIDDIFLAFQSIVYVFIDKNKTNFKEI